MMDFSKFDVYKKKIDKELNKVINSTDSIGTEKLYESANHLIKAGGKRIRPTLCLLACKSVGGGEEKALKTGVAVELIHTFSLIHDDMMDRDEKRRGVKAVHRAYNDSLAILSGDLLFSQSFQLSSPKTFKIIASSARQICEGQYLDISFEKRNEVSEKEYLTMIGKKTAALFKAATHAGAIMGDGENKEIVALKEFGWNLGLAFQMQDDILGIQGEEKKLGKPVGSDIMEGKKNLITIHALQKEKEIGKQELSSILDQKTKSEKEITRAVELCQSHQSIEYTKARAQKYVQKAHESLKILKDSEAKQDLKKITSFVIEREI